MTFERIAQLQTDPRVATALHGAPINCLTALTIFHAGRVGLLTPAESEQFADLPLPWIEQARSAVSAIGDDTLLNCAPSVIARAVASTLDAPERWRQVLPLVTRRQDVLAADGVR